LLIGTLNSLQVIRIASYSLYRWSADTPPYEGIHRILRRIENDPDFSGFYATADLYQFLMTLKRYGQTKNKLPLSDTMLKLQPLLDWLDENYSNPEIGLIKMAQKLSITPRYMNTLILYFAILFHILLTPI
jgi:AraC family transcriptional regulator, arabinose operon regulatory protein